MLFPSESTRSRKQKSFLLGVIAHECSPLTQNHCRLAKKKYLKGQIHFNRAGKKSKFGAKMQQIDNQHTSI